jgi:hypothetical protein
MPPSVPPSLQRSLCVLGHRAEAPRGPHVMGHREGSSCLGPTSQVSNGLSCLGVPRAIGSSLQGVLLSWAIEPSLQESVCLGPSSQVSKGSSCLGPITRTLAHVIAVLASFHFQSPSRYAAVHFDGRKSCSTSTNLDHALGQTRSNS